MRNFLFIFFLALVASIATTRCVGPDLEPLPFITVSIFAPDPIGLGKTRLRAEVGGLKKTNPIEEHGFIWSTSNADPKLGQAGINLVKLGVLEGSAVFETILDGLSPEVENYYARAFVLSNGETFYSEEVASFSFKFEVKITSNVIVDNNRAFLEGFITGLQTLGDSVLEHGHVLSITDPFPTLEKGIVRNLGSTNDDEVFSSRFDGLEFNTTYFARAYARISDGQVVYSKTTERIPIKDGWNLAATARTPFWEAVGLSLWDKGFLGIGCDNAEYCDVNVAANNHFWQFSLSSKDSVEATWLELREFEGRPRAGAVSFVMDNKIFVGLGGLSTGAGDIFYPNDFWEFDPVSNGGIGSWNQKDPFPGKPRKGAVAFVINGKAYVGSGKRENIFLEYFDDFYAFNPNAPAGQQWNKIASLPVIEREGSLPAPAGRAEAVAFAIGEIGYVGTGSNLSGLLKDFWKYDPLQDKWIQDAFFKGLEREGAVGFTIGNRGYIGTGYTTNNNYLDDFWEYDPARATTNRWLERTRFQGPKRDQAVGLSFGNYGMVGTGRGLVIINNQVELLTFDDIWRYTPEK
ncbi:MAG: N-acetylneuraminate epimerase [Haliscomenobacter sp.]|jgi:N-acetylneuraminic acid mutarotase|nr:N-acetylneuraminate epimerase [Haliscomenobacter sp.]